MRTVTVNVQCIYHVEGHDLPGKEVVPGIAVIQSSTYCPVLCPDTPPDWSVIHIRSGLLVADTQSPEAAAACALDLAPLTDWTADGNTIRAAVPVRTIRAIADRWCPDRLGGRAPDPNNPAYSR